MNPDQPKQPDYDNPVAYDAKGRPLYAHPPEGDAEQTIEQPTEPVSDPPYANQPISHAPSRVVHMSRPIDPAKPEISPEARARHDRSQKTYPFLNLSEGEYIISAIRRHPIGLVIPLAIGGLLITITLSIMFNYASFAELFNIHGDAANPDVAVLPALFFTILVALGMFVVYYVYTNNKFFLTNESVIQQIQVSLFSRLEQTVSLVNIEDASYTQTNIIQYLFNYGSIRLSTEGDETTYRFTYVANPQHHIAVLNNAIEAFKNGRPVTDPTDD